MPRLPLNRSWRRREAVSSAAWRSELSLVSERLALLKTWLSEPPAEDSSYAPFDDWTRELKEAPEGP
jgi:hypothetical protein